MAYLKYGDFQHDENEVSITIDKNSKLNRFGVPYSLEHVWTIEGALFADSPAELTNRIRALEAAYSQHGKDAELFINGAVTAHRLISSQTINGVSVAKPPSYPTADPGEYTTFRKYQIVLRAETPIDVSQGNGGRIVAFSETVQFSGGGPMYRFLQPINGTPIKQMVAQATTYKAEQSGSAVGFDSYPLTPGPLWPGDEHRTLRRTGKRSAADGSTNFEVFWNYSFESVYPLSGNPHNNTI
jgi:hypothetical protein